MSQSELEIATPIVVSSYLISRRIERVKSMFVQVSVSIGGAIAAECMVTTERNIDSKSFVVVNQ